MSRLRGLSRAERKAPVPKINLDDATNEKYRLEPGSRHRALTGMDYMLSEQVKSPDFKWAHNLGTAKFMKTITGVPGLHGAGRTQPVGFYFHSQHFKLAERAKPEPLGVVAGQPLKTKTKVLMPVTSIDETARQLAPSDFSTARHLESQDSLKQGGRRREVMKVYQQPFTSKRSSIQDIVSHEQLQASTKSLKHDLSFARQNEEKALSASSHTARAPNTPLTKHQPLMDVTYMPIPLNQIKIVTSPGHSSPLSSGRTGSPY